MRLLLALSLTAIISGVPARSHEAPTGWRYPYSCCSNHDCREIPADWVKEGPSGYVIVMTGEVVGYGDTRLRRSPDGKKHWCSVAGDDHSRTICLYVPDAGS